MSTGKIELSVGVVKYADLNEMITEEEYNYIKNKIPELDERVDIVEDEIEEINSSLDNKANQYRYDCNKYTDIDIQKLIDECNAKFKATGKPQDNIITLRGGEYTINNTVRIPPYIKIRSNGYCIFNSNVTNGATFHITPLADDVENILGVRQEFWNGNPFDGSEGGFYLRFNKDRTLYPNSIAIEIGTSENLGVSKNTARFKLSNFVAIGFGVGLQLNVYNNYLTTFSKIHLEGNSINVRVGKIGMETISNSGENITFSDCIFAGSNVAYQWYTPMFEVNFRNCSFDFNECVFFTPNDKTAMINCDGCHFEAWNYNNKEQVQGILFGDSGNTILNINGGWLVDTSSKPAFDLNGWACYVNIKNMYYSTSTQNNAINNFYLSNSRNFNFKNITNTNLLEGKQMHPLYSFNSDNILNNISLSGSPSIGSKFGNGLKVTDVSNIQWWGSGALNYGSQVDGKAILLTLQDSSEDSIFEFETDFMETTPNSSIKINTIFEKGTYCEVCILTYNDDKTNEIASPYTALGNDKTQKTSWYISQFNKITKINSKYFKVRFKYHFGQHEGGDVVKIGGHFITKYN